MDCKKLLKKLTLREKIMQLTQIIPRMFATDDNGVLTGPIANLSVSEQDLYNTGSSLNVFGGEKSIDLQNRFLKNNKHGIPLCLMQDVIHGYKTIYPIQLALGCSFNTELVKECSSMAAKECSVDGVHLTFAPMVDLVRDARWGRVMESTGEDPYLNSLMATAQVQGLQGDLGKYKVGACVKHLAAYGGAESGLDYNTVDMSERTLRQYYLPAYKAAVDAGVEMVMTAFNTVDGVPAVGNKWLVNDVLRKEWGFNGVVISDFNAVQELITHGVAKDGRQAAEMAINATTDIEMGTTEYLKNAEQLIAEGKITEKQIDQAVMRVLELKKKLGLFENPHKDTNPTLAKEIILCKEHRDLARRMSEESAVLLKNDNVLPFNKDVESIAVIGPHADTGFIKGFWSYASSDKDTTTVLKGFTDYLGEDKVKYAYGCSAELTNKDESQIAKAVEVAKSCSAVVLCIGEVETDSGEGNSKSNLELSDLQYKLVEEVLKVNKNTVVALFTGRPLAIKKLQEIAPAILNMWMPGTEGGPALANLVFGVVSPSGRLSMTFPASTGQCPIYYNHLNTGRPAPNREITYGYCATYIDGPTYPLYPFGYGLTYSNVEYKALELSSDKMTEDGTITASITVENVGDRKVKEVVQMYIRDLVGSVARPVKELKGFKKIELEAGEKKTITFEITKDLLAFYTKDLEFKAEKGEFRVFIGKDSDVEEYKTFQLI